MMINNHTSNKTDTREATYDPTESIPNEKQLNHKKSGRGRNAKKVSLNSTMMSEPSETSVAIPDVNMELQQAAPTQDDH